MARKKSVHYVDNKVFLEAMKEWKEQCREAEAVGDGTPRISDYIGTGFTHALYSTYISYLPPNNFSYRLNENLDEK